MHAFFTKLPTVLRYLIAGGTSTAIDLGILYVLTEYLGWWYLASATAAFAVAVVVSFVLQKFYTFAHRDVSRSVLATQSALYLMLQITNVGINAVLMYALVEWVGLWYLLAQIIAAAAIALASFFVYRFVIFHPTILLTNRAKRAGVWIREYRAAFVVAVLVSLLYGAHHFLMPQFLPEDTVYKPVTYASDHDAGGYYGPRANAFFSRNELDSPSLLPMANPVIMGGLGKLFGSIERAFTFSDFLFPPLIFLAVYALARELLHRKTLALLLASIFIVSPLAGLLSPSAPIFAESVPLYFSSFEYPKITFLFYIGALFFIARVLARGGKKNILLAGIFFGALFYTYLFDWVYLAAALFLMLIFFGLRREWSVARSCVGVLGVGALVSVPYWFNFAALRRLPQYNDLAFRIGGLEVGRHFRFASVWKTYARHLAWIAALAITAVKRIPRAAAFLISLLAAYFVVVNVQVVLGFSPQPDHWYRETFLPVLLSLGAVGGWLWDRYLARRAFARRATLCVFIFLALFFTQAFYGQYRLSRENAVRWSISRASADAYAWLNTHTESGSVVGSFSPETNRNLALFTHNTLFLPSGGLTLVSNEEIWNRLYALSALWRLTPMELQEFAQKSSYYLFQDYYRPRILDTYFKTASSPLIPESELRVRTDAYAALVSAGAPVALPAPSYLFMDIRADAPTSSTFPKYSLAYKQGDMRIYKINDER